MPRTKKEPDSEEEAIVLNQEEVTLEDQEQGMPVEGDEPLREDPEGEEMSPDDEGEESEKKESQAMPDQTKQRIRAHKTRHVVTLENQRTVVSENDRANEKLLDLVESMKAGRILTGAVQGVEMSETGDHCRVVLYHGDYKILIPGEEFTRLPKERNGRKPSEMLYAMAVSRLGAEVDYIVRGIDPGNHIAVGSRLIAMKRRSKRFYRRETEPGLYWVRPGKRAEARVVSAIKSGIFADVLGVETFIPVGELSYQRIWNAAHVYQPGQRIMVRILTIDRSDWDNIQVTASVKQANAHPFAKAAWKYKVGECYVGKVSMVDYTGVFVSLDGGVDCLCGYPARGRPPRGARVTVRINGIDPVASRIWGVITHVSALHLEE